MKLWMFIPLVVFIAIAGYQFGFYHAKLELSEAKKANLPGSGPSEGNTTLADNMVATVNAAEISNAAQKELATRKRVNSDDLASAIQPMSTAHTVEKLAVANNGKRVREEALADFVANYKNDDLDIEIATHINDFFSLHPKGDKVYFHHIKCNNEQCQLVGQFDGPHDTFENMLEKMKEEDWYSFGGTSSSISSDDNSTHFILHLTDRARKS